MKDSNFVWVNGQILKYQKAKIPLLTHSLHYGSGVFEGVRFYKTKNGIAVFRLAEHIRRLLSGVKAVGAESPYSKSQIIDAVINLIKSNKLNNGYVRLLFYYGEGAMQVIPHDIGVNLAIAVWPLKSYLDSDIVKVMISKYKRISNSATKVDAKLSGNYINSLLAGLEAREKGFHEALLLDSNGNIAEGSAENIFFIRENKLFTPKLGSILPGITRDSLIKIANDIGYNVNEVDIKPNKLKNFSECFLCGTATEIVGISQIEGYAKYGNRIGKVTQKLKSEFLDIVHGNNKKYNKWLTYINN